MPCAVTVKYNFLFVLQCKSLNVLHLDILQTPLIDVRLYHPSVVVKEDDEKKRKSDISGH